MLKRNLWKIVLSLAILAWAVASLLPLKDQPFAAYARSHATAKPAEFAQLVDEAAGRFKAAQARSDFVALKQIAKERKIDLSQYFPKIRLEASLKNVEKRNDILMGELLRRSKGRLQPGLDLAGGVAFTLEVASDPTLTNNEARREKITKAIEIISDRINGFGVAEPIIRPIGDTRIEIQLPGVNTKDDPEVVNKVKAPAKLDFRTVHPTLTPGPGVETPPGYDILTEDREGPNGETYVDEVFVKRIPEMTGEAMESAFVIPNQWGQPEVSLEFTKEGQKRFAEVTAALVASGQRAGRPGRLAVVLDGRLYSSPTVQKVIDGNAVIQGRFSVREALDLANVLNNPLDVELRVAEQYEVGPTLAKESVVSAKNAFIISSVLTVGFMLVFYTMGGVVAAIGMGVNVLVTLGVLVAFGASLTMPGIAGIVLTLAMSVDSNILIFERMREELKAGKSLPAALEAGFDKAWTAILDSNITTLLVAAVMIWLGTGPVKGFGVTLAIGIFTTMFAAVVVSKLLLEALIHPGVIKSMKMFSVLQNTKIDFLRYAKPAFIASWIVVAVGLAMVVYKGEKIYGIDFLGGDQVTMSFAQKVDVARLNQVAAQAGIKEATFAYQKQIGSGGELLKVTTPFDQGKPLLAKLQESLPEAKLQPTGDLNRIGPSVGKEIRWNAAWSIFWSLVLIFLYVAFRFEIGYGMGAVISTVHDLLITVGFFVLFGRQFNGPMVAAILLIIGYSINDTVVVFDRIREELKLNPTGTLFSLINRALNLTLSRTIITGGTTLLTAITLIAVTTGDVNDIAFTLLIGVLTGTFSSLFIASPVFYWWHKGDRKHVEAHHDVAPKYEWQGTSKAAE
ncbi:MAG TPA: protein translocase subunit SecD [Opitutaceae bacterium]|nr:protein translocase subunit SecD [Opitutaceae bacterium]